MTTSRPRFLAVGGGAATALMGRPGGPPSGPSWAIDSGAARRVAGRGGSPVLPLLTPRFLVP